MQVQLFKGSESKFVPTIDSAGWIANGWSLTPPKKAEPKVENDDDDTPKKTTTKTSK